MFGVQERSRARFRFPGRSAGGRASVRRAFCATIVGLFALSSSMSFGVLSNLPAADAETGGGIGNGAMNVSSAIAAGNLHTCALMPDGTAECWGTNQYGNLGNGTMAASSNVPVAVGGRQFTSISGGFDDTCGITIDASVYCWGYNLHGQLGLGNYTNASTPQAVGAGGQSGALVVADGAQHTCVLYTGSHNFGAHPVFCWGNNTYGQLGLGTYADATTPTALPSPMSGEATALASGYEHTCALMGDQVFCWGLNTDGEVGDGTTTNRPSPTLITIAAEGIAISAGGYHTCVLMSNGSVYCWGNNTHGQIGD